MFFKGKITMLTGTMAIEIVSLPSENYDFPHLPSCKQPHHFYWGNSLFLWSFSIALLNYQRVCLAGKVMVSVELDSI